MAGKQKWLKEMLADGEGYASSRRFGYIVSISTICISLLACVILFIAMAAYSTIQVQASVFPTLAQFVSMFSAALLTAATAGYVAGGFLEKQENKEGGQNGREE